jgi:eukaryotic-like serine/threonine-protein kinase
MLWVMESIATSAAALPETLGRYELLGVLGRGGMANVYLGRHAGGAGFQRLFAIKVLHPHLAQEEAFIEMLLDEARIAARLHHPNVVPIVDLGNQDGIYYVVMEYVEGCALSVLLKKNRDRRPPRLLIPIILDALSGLHAAHTLTDDDGSSMRLVHRDVSPQNILVGVDGMARLTDFGIAKAESRINSTRPGELKGKISFMSPEQIKNPESVDHRSDVFSAGVLLWTALTGRQLFEAGSTGAAMNNTLRMAIEPPSQVGLKPPAVFDAICLRALERNVAARLDSALEFEESLRSAAAANGLCGSRREVGEWVLAAVGEELAERRNANKSSGSQRIARRIHSPAGGFSAITDSRLKLDAAVQDGVPSIEPISIVSSSHSATRESSPVIESAPISARELGTEGRRRNAWLLAGGSLALVGGLAWGATRLDLGPSSAPALAASVPKSAQASVATTRSAPAAPPEEATPPAADDATTAQTVPTSTSAEPSRSEPSRRRAPSMAVRRSASTALQPVGVATPTPAPKPESASAASEPRAKKPVWDEDSPLPHP